MSGLIEIASAEDLAAWMRRMNLSLTAAADQLGRKRATISRYIKGESDIPESICRHASVIEAARRGKPFRKREREPAGYAGQYAAF
jgi:IS30 family transposase